MLKVDSRKTLNLITLRFLRESRGRNLVAGLAVILTTVMFTSLFTATVSMMKTIVISPLSI